MPLRMEEMRKSPKRVTSGSEHELSNEVLRDKHEFTIVRDKHESTNDALEDRHDLKDDASRNGYEFYDDIPGNEDLLINDDPEDKHAVFTNVLRDEFEITHDIFEDELEMRRASELYDDDLGGKCEYESSNEVFMYEEEFDGSSSEQEFEDIDGFTYDIPGDKSKSCEEDAVYEDDLDEWEKDLFDSGIAMGDEMKELFYELKEVGKFDSYQEVKSRLVKLAIDDDEVVHEVDKLVDKLTKLLLEIVSLQSRLSAEIEAHKVEEEDTCSDDENESELGRPTFHE